MTTNTEQPSLPPAPDGFAWMPLTQVLPPPIKGETWYTYGDTCVCLMRRLGPREEPWGGCWVFLRPEDEWHAYAPLPGFGLVRHGWYAPVRFVPGQAPDFGEEGWRLCDKGELFAGKCLHPESMNTGYGPAILITLPSLPTPDPWTDEAPIHKDASRCTAASPAECGRAHLQRPTRPGPEHASPTAQGEEGTEADAFDRSRAAYDEILADASDARRLRADVETLRAQLAHYREIAQRAAIDSTDPARWLEALEEIAEGVW